ncbi:MAG TPA: hypothetical protein VFG89_08950 [Coriobacteriia bacterium]|nr:hypothetical protein [Coriobacteriia bacterium]
MTQTAVAAPEAPQPKQPKSPGVVPLAILLVGALTLVSWMAFLAGGVLAVTEETTRLLSDAQLAAVVLSALAALVSRQRTFAVVSIVAGVAYIGAWAGLGLITWGGSDIVNLALIALFYLSVPVSGVSTLLAGRSLVRARA